ncbi:MAG TPA: TetR/AcrR family transcriptional regulator [Alphaproteobacteria bacterium]|jgi:AcrR family transcriptional regulator|nr:TetR/AcrR family transcriptional regulator [Alphaproteobacteria bacterium]
MAEITVLDAPQVPPLLVPPRPRPGGRTELQQRQKQTSREKLLAAAREAFAEGSYAGAAIDDIVKRAGVNRSTFYRHFDSKFAAAKALFEPFWPRLFAQYGSLAPAGEQPTDEEIDRWIDGFLTLYHPNRPLLDISVQIGILEPEGTQWENAIRQEVIRLLGRSIPAFRAAQAEGASPDARIRVWLLLMQVELCLFQLAFNPEADRPATVRVLGEQFRAFTGR